jgi:ABC-type branched-subunit amino acid transport system substrate-binding protein
LSLLVYFLLREWLIRVKPEYKIALFYQPDKEFSSSLTKAFKNAIRSKYPNDNIIVKEFDLTRSNDIKNEIEQAKKAKANSIVLFPDAYTSDNRTNNKPEEVMVFNKGEMPILTNTSMYDSYEQKSQTPSVRVPSKLYKNVVMSIPWEYSNLQHRYSKELIPQDDPKQLPAIPKWWLYGNESISMLNQRIALSYDATSVLIKALGKAETSGRGGDNLYIQKIIADPDFRLEGITGNISFNGSDRHEKMDSLVTPNCNENECSGFKIYK